MEEKLDEQSPEEIREMIEHTKSSLVSKLGSLRQRVSNSVDETFETVAEKLSVARVVRERPWTAVAGAIAAGFVVAKLTGGARSRPRPRYALRNQTASNTEPGFGQTIAAMIVAEAAPALREVRRVAVQAGATYLTDLIRSTLQTPRNMGARPEERHSRKPDLEVDREDAEGSKVHDLDHGNLGQMPSDSIVRERSY